jgi:hypothetical protein
MNRRSFLSASITASTAAFLPGVGAAADEPAAKPRPNRIAVSTYSYWRFNDETKLPIEKCIELAADAGFDGVEVLHIQMTDESNAALMKIKQRAFRLGMDLCGFSTHQSFISPDAEFRKKNVEHTKRCIELAYRLGIPTIRVNTGRWGTSKNFDVLMANKGIEPRSRGVHRRRRLQVGDRWPDRMPAQSRGMRCGDGPRKPLGSRPRCRRRPPDH